MDRNGGYGQSSEIFFDLVVSFLGRSGCIIPVDRVCVLREADIRQRSRRPERRLLASDEAADAAFCRQRTSVVDLGGVRSADRQCLRQDLDASVDIEYIELVRDILAFRIPYDDVVSLRFLRSVSYVFHLQRRFRLLERVSRRKIRHRHSYAVLFAVVDEGFVARLDDDLVRRLCDRQRSDSFLSNFVVRSCVLIDPLEVISIQAASDLLLRAVRHDACDAVFDQAVDPAAGSQAFAVVYLPGRICRYSKRLRNYRYPAVLITDSQFVRHVVSVSVDDGELIRRRLYSFSGYVHSRCRRGRQLHGVSFRNACHFDLGSVLFSVICEGASRRLRRDLLRRVDYLQAARLVVNAVVSFFRRAVPDEFAAVGRHADFSDRARRLQARRLITDEACDRTLSRQRPCVVLLLGVRRPYSKHSRLDHDLSVDVFDIEALRYIFSCVISDDELVSSRLDRLCRRILSYRRR